MPKHGFIIVLMTAWAIVDCILEIDVGSKSVVAYV
jgi:hypothetical protein